MKGKVLLLFHTLRHLKLSQIFWQIFYRIQPKSVLLSPSGQVEVKNVGYSNVIGGHLKYLGNNSFEFLNYSKSFGDEVDWDFLSYGKLWNYNLEYFDYLHQADLAADDKLRLLTSFYEYSVKTRRTLEPYPVSLRAINIIKFVSINKIEDGRLNQNLFQELEFLSKHLEYHILGNHLLENAFALLLGGAFFDEQKWQATAKEILLKELDEQILSDGGHFELSPMYHQIIFFRVLELIDWYSSYTARDEQFLSFCKKKAREMRSWLENIVFRDGDIPLFNDAAKGIAYDFQALIAYSDLLGLEATLIPLGESGYRSYANDRYEVKIDLAQIGASYQPGHAHADALSFILYYQGKPLFVEQGTSTYQIGERRNLERSTEAHNTVVVRGENQSEVWGGFRVGRRAKTTILDEQPNLYVASHDGYKKHGVIHRRTFSFGENEMRVTDSLSKKENANFYLHLHPSCTLSQNNEQQFSINSSILVSFEGAHRIVVEEYDYAESYNQYERGQRLVVSFEDGLSTVIVFEQS